MTFSIVNRSTCSHVGGHTCYHVLGKSHQIVAMAQVQITSYWDLAIELKDIDSTIAWCRGRGMLSTRHDCATICGRSCRIVKRTRYPGKIVLHCIKNHFSDNSYPYRRSCMEMSQEGVPKIVSIRDGTFFSNSNL